MGFCGFPPQCFVFVLPELSPQVCWSFDTPHPGISQGACHTNLSYCLSWGLSNLLWQGLFNFFFLPSLHPLGWFETHTHMKFLLSFKVTMESHTTDWRDGVQGSPGIAGLRGVEDFKQPRSKALLIGWGALSCLAIPVLWHYLCRDASL